MPAYFHLDLDTSSPVVTWVHVTGVSPGRLVTVDYTIDEPAVVAAQFVDANDVATNMDVTATKLFVFVPETTPYGEAVIRAWVQDDVGNTAVRSLTVQVQPAYVHIDLDTTPPIITWGPVNNTDAGDDFYVLYTIDEPEILTAELELADHRVLPMTVLADRLTVTLPFDTPDGLGTVRAYVRDDVGNEATRTLVVALTGVAQPPSAPSYGGGGVPRRIVGPRLVTSSRSAAKTTSRATSEAMLAAQPVKTHVRVGYNADAATLVRLITRGTIRTRGGRIVSVKSDPSVVVGSAHFGIEKTAEGPETEAALLLLLELV